MKIEFEARPPAPPPVLPQLEDTEDEPPKALPRFTWRGILSRNGEAHMYRTHPPGSRVGFTTVGSAIALSIVAGLLVGWMISGGMDSGPSFQSLAGTLTNDSPPVADSKPGATTPDLDKAGADPAAKEAQPRTEANAGGAQREPRDSSRETNRNAGGNDSGSTAGSSGGSTSAGSAGGSSGGSSGSSGGTTSGGSSGGTAGSGSSGGGSTGGTGGSTGGTGG